MARPAAPAPKVTGKVCNLIRSGGFPAVAAAACGIAPARFEALMLYGAAENAPEDLAAFYEAVMTAWAEVRLLAETRVYKQQPRQWLLNGAGRPGLLGDGWARAAVAPAAAAVDALAGDVLAAPGVQQLLALIVQALAPFPEAAAAIAESLESLNADACTG